MDLLVERNAWIGAEEHERAPRRPILARHDVFDRIAGGGSASIEQALDVNAALAFMLEFEVIVKAFVAGDFGERGPNAGENGEVIL